MSTTGTLILTASEVDASITLGQCIEAVEEVFARLARGELPPPSVLGVHVATGGFHVKAAVLPTPGSANGRSWFVAKTNANFPGNPERYGLPSIQGVVVLMDAERGTPVALIDSMRLTELRTAAATGVAAAHLCREGPVTAAIIGCGAQAPSQVRALAAVREVTELRVHDVDVPRAGAFAARMGSELGIPVEVCDSVSAATRGAEAVVTCTPASTPILSVDDLSPGSFVAAVGADNPGKCEIRPELMAAAAVVVDSLSQALEIGDLRHAVAAGVMEPDDVRAELGPVVAGLAPGRTSDDEIVVFDSTGTAIQDVAAAARVYERALDLGKGLYVDLSG